MLDLLLWFVWSKHRKLQNGLECRRVVGCNSDEGFPVISLTLAFPHSVLSLLFTQFSKTNLLLLVPTPASDLEEIARAILLL